MRAPIPGTHEPGWVEPSLIQESIPAELKAVMPAGQIGLAVFRFGECSIIRAREKAGKAGEWLWHLSISHPSRHPSWDEIKTARYRLLGADLTFGLLLPPPELYVNVPSQDHVFHLWEITDPREPWGGL